MKIPKDLLFAKMTQSLTLLQQWQYKAQLSQEQTYTGVVIFTLAVHFCSDITGMYVYMQKEADFRYLYSRWKFHVKLLVAILQAEAKQISIKYNTSFYTTQKSI